MTHHKDSQLEKITFSLIMTNDVYCLKAKIIQISAQLIATLFCLLFSSYVLNHSLFAHIHKDSRFKYHTIPDSYWLQIQISHKYMTHKIHQMRNTPVLMH